MDVLRFLTSMQGSRSCHGHFGASYAAVQGHKSTFKLHLRQKHTSDAPRVLHAVSSGPTTTGSSCLCSSSSGSGSSSSSSSSSSSNLDRAMKKVKARRGSVVVQALFGSRPTRQLWNYHGSNVRQLSLEDVQLLHRLSFGHRNQRSYLIVLYQSDSPACQAFEQEVERLASGLRHELAFVAAALDVSDSKAANFAAHMLGVEQVPAVLLYPEAARGCLKFLGPDMSARGMLAAVNAARQKAWPATSTSQGAVEWQLREAATPLAVTAVRAAAQTGDREAVVAALHQQLPSLQPTPLNVTQQSTYWSQGRVMFWSGLLFCSFLLLVWDLKLADAWEDWCLSRRQAARARGKKFTVQENLDDMVTLLMKGVQSKVTAAPLAPVAAEVDRQQQSQQAEPLLQEQQQQQQQNAVAGAFARRQQRQQQTEGTGAEQAMQQPEHQTQQEKQQQQDLTMNQQQGGSWVLDQQS